MSKQKLGDIAYKLTSCAAYGTAVMKMENHMSLVGHPLSTQKNYIRGVRDLMEAEVSIPKLLSIDQIKAHLVTWRG